MERWVFFPTYLWKISYFEGKPAANKATEQIMFKGIDCLKVQFSSRQFKMASIRSEKPMRAPPRLSEVSRALPLKPFSSRVSQLRQSH